MPALSSPPSALAALLDRLTPEQRQAVLESSRRERLKTLAAHLKVSEPEALTAVEIASDLGVATNLEADDAALGLLPARLVHEYQLVPILYKRGTAAPIPAKLDLVDPSTPLHLATAWPPDDVIVDWIRTFTARPIVWHLGVAEKIHQLILQHFGVGSGSLEGSDDGYVAPESVQANEAEVDEEAAVVRFVTDVISQAVSDEATDIHFEPQ